MIPTVGSNAPLEPEEIPAVVSFGREICGEMEAAEKREWLVTNGIGGVFFGDGGGRLSWPGSRMQFFALHTPVGGPLLVLPGVGYMRANTVLFYVYSNHWAC